MNLSLLTVQLTLNCPVVNVGSSAYKIFTINDCFRNYVHR